ncbi:hypothetical protein J4710_08555 [Staphylococcus xylosus]|uniref:Uncharacterized protein n=1 Tax=Staphylococcus xylosus TaxID=1288 RepID=A0A939NDG4_STAXY|nr:hypothetical protein [Staphylococcus xylosus]
MNDKDSNGIRYRSINRNRKQLSQRKKRRELDSKLTEITRDGLINPSEKN